MVEHDEKTKSFYLLEDGYKAFICYDVQNGEFDVLTTQVPKAISGRGLASQLMKACASFVKEKGLKFKKISPALMLNHGLNDINYFRFKVFINSFSASVGR